jgi:succinyl-CoA synthetase beta subunit
MLDDLGLLPLLARLWGDRDTAVVDRIAQVVAQVSGLAAADAADVPVLVEINPLMVSLDGREVVAADALVQLSIERTRGNS